MLNVALYLLTLAPLFLQTVAGTFVQSTSALEKNSTGSVELELDDGKPLPNFPNNKYPFPSFDRGTNPHNGTRTGLQPAAVHSMPIKGTSPLVVGMNMLDTTSKIPTKTSVVSGREQLEQLDDGKGLDHFGIGSEFKCLLDSANGRKFNADVKTGVMDAHLSGGKVNGNKSETCLNLDRNHPDVVENEENRKVVQKSKTILPIDEDACTFDLKSKNQKILNIGLDKKFLDRDVDPQILSVLEHPDETEELCYCGAPQYFQSIGLKEQVVKSFGSYRSMGLNLTYSCDCIVREGNDTYCRVFQLTCFANYGKAFEVHDDAAVQPIALTATFLPGNLSGAAANVDVAAEICERGVLTILVRKFCCVFFLSFFFISFFCQKIKRVF